MGKSYKLTEEVKSQILSEYVSDPSITLRDLSKKYKIHHVSISALLKRHNIKVRRTGARIGHPVKDSTRQIFSKIHKNNKYSLGKAQKDTTKLKIIATKWGLDHSKLLCYQNYEKVHQITIWLNSERNIPSFDGAVKLKYLHYFYNDPVFTAIWDRWIISNKEPAYKPSIDHKVPFTKGGSADLDNLQVITWFENRAKGNMTLDEWSSFKKLNNLKCDLFVL